MSTLVKKYLCVICGKGQIVESIVEQMMEGGVPDISNCDFSTYSDHKITGGKLLANSPRVDWKTLRYFKVDEDLLVSSPPGGICTDCLNSNATVRALSSGEHISFVDERKLKNTKWE